MTGDADAGRCAVVVQAGDQADFVGAALFDGDCGTVGAAEIESGTGRGDVGWDVVGVGGERLELGADLVGG